jgi:nicotinamidase-related amidase
MSRALQTIGPDAVHVVIDMQRLFAEDTGWRVASLPGIVPTILKLVRCCPARALYTRFITPPSQAAARGAWRSFYRHWPQVTQDRLAPGLLDLVAPLSAGVTPAQLIDKEGFSAYSGPFFQRALSSLEARTLVLSGVETDVCVLATALEAVDRGHRVVIAADAVTSFSPAGHRAVLDHVLPRYEHMIDVADAAEIIAAWQS